MADQKRPKYKRVIVSPKARWDSILKQVDTKDIPIMMIDHIDVRLVDGSIVEIDVKGMLNDGENPNKLEKEITSKIKSLDHIIDDVDMYVNVDSVVKTVSTVTKKLFKDFK